MISECGRDGGRSLTRIMAFWSEHIVQKHLSPTLLYRLVVTEWTGFPSEYVSLICSDSLIAVSSGFGGNLDRCLLSKSLWMRIRSPSGCASHPSLNPVEIGVCSILLAQPHGMVHPRRFSAGLRRLESWPVSVVGDGLAVASRALGHPQ